ncbi:hypothetical protein SAMN05446635_5581 [Burkholderia sp. OK233]|nr:hypothetical protein SAMN05446635_5581 [Burkholderia sp. OK233]
MVAFEPTYITFACHGTPTKFRIAEMAHEIYGYGLQGVELGRFVVFFAGYRPDDVLGVWKPYNDVVVTSVRRACQRMGVAFNRSEAGKFYLSAASWGQHPDVPECLPRLAKKYKLVPQSNASDDRMHVPSSLRYDLMTRRTRA